MTKEDLIKYRKIRLLQIVKEEYVHQKMLDIKRLKTLSDEELETYSDNIIIGKEAKEEIERRKSKRKILK